MTLSRSEHMARVRGKNTSPEKILRSALWRAGLRYRLHAKTPVGRPDIVFPKQKVAVFIDGCFWHGCPSHYSRPKTREEFWAEKLAANVDRDRRQTLELEERGWRVVRVWEHEILGDLPKVVEVVRESVQGQMIDSERDWRVVKVEPAPKEGPGWERRELRLLRDDNTVRYEVGPRKTGSDKARRLKG